MEIASPLLGRGRVPVVRGGGEWGGMGEGNGGGGGGDRRGRGRGRGKGRGWGGGGRCTYQVQSLKFFALVHALTLPQSVQW